MVGERATKSKSPDDIEGLLDKIEADIKTNKSELITHEG